MLYDYLVSSYSWFLGICNPEDLSSDLQSLFSFRGQFCLDCKSWVTASELQIPKSERSESDRWQDRGNTHYAFTLE